MLIKNFHYKTKIKKFPWLKLYKDMRYLIY